MIWTLIQVYHGLTDGFLFLKRVLLVFIMVCHIFSPSILGPTCRASSESSQPVGSHLVSIALHAMFEILGMAQRRLDTAGYPPNLYCVADCSWYYADTQNTEKIPEFKYKSKQVIL